MLADNWISYRPTGNSVFCMLSLRGLFFIVLRAMFIIFGLKSTGCIKRTEQILNRSQRREAAQNMKFLINIDCLGTSKL